MKIESFNKKQLDEYNPQNDPDVLIWEENRKQQWEDFLGKPDMTNHFDALSNVVTYSRADTKIIKVGFGYEFEIVNIETYALFRKSTSWVKSNALRSSHEPILLQHEQCHFDIEEYFSRKFKSEIITASKKRYKCKGSTFDECKQYADEKLRQILKKTQTKVNIERNTYNQEYESKTDYSKNNLEQEKYNHKIQEMLKAFDP